MFHLIKYSVIRKVKNFSMLFWPCMFPLILGTLFILHSGTFQSQILKLFRLLCGRESGRFSISVIPGRSQQRRNFDPCGNNDRKKKRCRSLRIRKSPEIFYGTETPYLKVGKKRTCSEYYAKSSGELFKWKGYAGNSGRCTS